MRLGPGLLYEGRTLQGARPKLADFCSATMAEFYSAVDNRPYDLSSGHPPALAGELIAAPLRFPIIPASVLSILFPNT